MNDFLVIKVSKTATEQGNEEILLAEVKEFVSKQPNTDYLILRKSLLLYLTEKNKRQTPERFKILEKICSHNQIFTKLDIYKKVSEDIHISLKTVSSTFELLEKAGIVQSVFEVREKFKPVYFELCKR